MPPAPRDPIPDSYEEILGRLKHEAMSLTNGDPGSVDNVQRRGNIDACIAKLQAISAAENTQATRRIAGSTDALKSATWAMFWVTVALAIGNFVLALTSLYQAGFFKRA